MPSRRLATNEALAPVQEVAVNPYSAYNSDNVNMLTRVVTGEKERDFVINGLGATGVNRVDTEVPEPAPTSNIDDDFQSYVNQAAVDLVWDSTYCYFDTAVGKRIRAEIPAPATSAHCVLMYGTAPSALAIGKLFKITFTLTDTPRFLHIQFGSEIKTYTRPSAGTFEFYMELHSNGSGPNNFTIIIDLDDQDTYSDNIVYIDDVLVEEIANPGTDIDPITDPDVDPDDINEALLHPHEYINVFPGVAVKDEVMVNILGTRPEDEDIAVLTLEYNDDDNWISGQAFQAADFVGTSNLFPTGTSGFTAGVLNTTLKDDGEVGGPIKVVGDSGNSVIQWAYLCMYYSYFKNPDGNHAYIGLAKEDEVGDTRYGEDYLILAKIRFVDINTADAIFYYPERQDYGFIDATRVTYLHLGKLAHWLNRPINASLAMDALASRIYNYKGVMFFQTYQDFVNWRTQVLPTGAGHGPLEYLQWLNGAENEMSYDLLAYVLQTNSYWKSRITTTGQIDSISIGDGGTGYLTGDSIVFTGGVPQSGTVAVATVVATAGVITSINITNNGAGYENLPALSVTSGGGSGAELIPYMDPSLTGYNLDVEWAEIQADEFEVDWSNVNSGSWPTAVQMTALTAGAPGTWSWNGVASAPGGDAAGFADAKAKWPYEYYEVTGSPALTSGITVVNPFNATGRGKVPGPREDEVLQDVSENKFLRADGTWQPASGDFKFYLHGWPQLNMVIGEIIVSQPRTITKIYYSADNAPQGTIITDDLTFKLKRCRAGVWADIASATGTIAVGYTQYTVNTTSLSPSYELQEDDILAVEITNIGVVPNEGGNDLTVTVY